MRVSVTPLVDAGTLLRLDGMWYFYVLIALGFLLPLGLSQVGVRPVQLVTVSECNKNLFKKIFYH